MCYNEIKVKSAVLLILSFLITGCSDDPVIYDSNIVTGKLVNQNLHPVSNVEIKIENQSVLTSADGSFTFKDITIPYDLKIVDTWDKTYYLYKGISSNNIIIPDFYGHNSSANFATVFISYPPEILNSDLQGKIIFTDFDQILTTADIRNSGIRIDLPFWNKNYKGKLILLTYKVSSDGSITSYENYAESEEISIDLNLTSDYFYNFTSQQVAFNPDEKKIYIKFGHPDGFTDQYGYLYLSVSKIEFPEISGDQIMQMIPERLDLVIPVNLPEYCKLYIYKAALGQGSLSENFLIEKNNYTSISFETKTPPAILSPENYSENVDNNTNFSFTPGEGNGVFTSFFYDLKNNDKYKVISFRETLNFQDVIDFGVNNVSDSDFFWNVTKSGQFNRMDEYMTAFKGNNKRFINFSGARFFKTGIIK